MTKFYTKSYTGFRLLREITLVLAVICGSLAGVKALDASVYAVKSRLAAGTWVKVAVTSGGMHFIPEGTLRSWGFSDPSKVKIYGYGGRRLPNLLGNSYLDDLPQTPSEMVAGNGLYFYAEGPKWWKSTSKGCNAPVSNPFTRQGYYFLSDSDPGERLTPQPIGDGAEPREDMMEFKDKVCHEVDMVSPGEAGFLLLGEDSNIPRRRNFPLYYPTR